MTNHENHHRNHETLAHREFGEFAGSGTLMVFGDAVTDSDGTLSQAYGETAGLGVVVTQPGARLSMESIAAAAQGGELYDGPVLVIAGTETYATDGELLVKLPRKKDGDAQKGAFGTLGDMLEVNKFDDARKGALPPSPLEAGKPWQPLVATGNTKPVTAVVLPGSSVFAIRNRQVEPGRNSFGLKGPEPVYRPGEMFSPTSQAKAHFERASRLLQEGEKGRVIKGLGELSIKTRPEPKTTPRPKPRPEPVFESPTVPNFKPEHSDSKYAKELLTRVTEGQASLLKAMLTGNGAITLGQQHASTGKLVSAVTRELEPADIDQIVRQYGREPKEVLAWGRELLFSIGGTRLVGPNARSVQLDSYLEDYFDLIAELDHKAFPPTSPETVRRGVPSYIPDGFVDLGGEAELRPELRDREQIVVDTRKILHRYKGVIKSMFNEVDSGQPLSARKRQVAERAALEVYRNLPYSDVYVDRAARRNNKVPLSELPEGVCRHHALTYQVMCQAMGLTSRVMKNYFNGGRHAANYVRLDYAWHIVDSTNPEFTTEGGRSVPRAAMYPIDRPIRPGERKRYEVMGKDGHKRIYEAHDDMYWYIQPMAS